MKQLRKHTAILAEILCFSGPPIPRPNLFESPSPMQKCSPFLTIDLKKNGKPRVAGLRLTFVKNIGPFAEIYRTATDWMGHAHWDRGLNEKKPAAEGITRLRQKVEKDAAAARSWLANHPRKDLIDDPYGD